MDHPDAPAGKARRYALLELERRFLVKEVPAGACIRRAEITDLYLTGTRVRLRRTIETTAGGTLTVRKLTQKIPAPGGGPGLITNFYLHDDEYAAFSRLPGVWLKKTRYSVPPFGVDVFGGELAGLLIAEIEFDTEDERCAFSVPPWAVEVTQDPRVTGGRLSVSDRTALLVILDSYGLAPLDATGLEAREITAFGD